MKKAGIIAGVIILLVVSITIFNINKKNNPNPKNSRAKQVQKTDRIKARNEALTYMSMAHQKAQKGDINGAMLECDKAIKIAPNEPVIQSCKRQIEHIQKRR